MIGWIVHIAAVVFAIIGLADVCLYIRRILLSGAPLSECRIVLEIGGSGYSAEGRLAGAVCRLRRDDLLRTAALAVRYTGGEEREKEVCRLFCMDEHIDYLD